MHDINSVKLNRADIIFEDADYIIVNKSAGVLTIPDRFTKTIPNLADILKQTRDEVFVVHRIDKDTSGIVCFAKNKDAHKDLNTQFENHTVSKNYIALVSGEIRDASGTIDLPISPDPANPGMVFIDKKKGKNSVTCYEFLERFKGLTLVNANPRTGRTHQIRIHFASIGHPLAVDPLYGNNDALFLSSFKRNYKLKKNMDEKPIMSRLTLHAEGITFKHLRTGGDISFRAPIPDDFATLLKLLRKYAK